MSRVSITEITAGERLDKFLAQASGLSRARVQDLCGQGLVLVNGKPAKSSCRLSEGDVVEAEIPADQPLAVEAENIPLDILYEDSDLIVINKPKGMVVHPAPGAESDTLVNALLYHCHDLSGINGVLRPGIVHRLDKDTTGCLVACKNDFTHTAIARQLEDKTCHREYEAVVEGVISDQDGLIDAPIGRDPRNRQRMTVTDKGSRPARTHFHVLERFRKETYIRCALETGRTHQIRVHMKFIQHPVVGDLKYGHACRLMDTHGQVLHARQLTFIHPRTGKEMIFTAPLPAYFEELLAMLRKENRE
jgi:23S rRNA pseudouridine1911/1915/1917 synthase